MTYPFGIRIMPDNAKASSTLSPKEYNYDAKMNIMTLARHGLGKK